MLTNDLDLIACLILYVYVRF